MFAGARRKGLLRPTSARTWYARGVALESQPTPDVAGAMHAYRRALAGCPDLADAHVNLGRLHHDRGELAEAETCYRLAICADANVALAWFDLGVVVEDRGRPAEAIAAYTRALALDPAHADAHHNLARLYEQLGRRAGDVEAMRAAIRHLASYRALVRDGRARRT